MNIPIKRIYAHELNGGNWLAAARTWLQSNVNNGETVTWGSEEEIRMSVRQFEEAAAIIAASAINEEREGRFK